MDIRMRMTGSGAGLLVLASLMGPPWAGAADTVASKNREGNRLFEQQKYQDAEKAYLQAQTEGAARPEIAYNLGNALVKQRKYDQAVQSLQQSIRGADRGLQANAWFNLGNALFEKGGFADSVQAYVQSLRINPADRDAKHNLELALQKMKEQKNQPQSGGDQNQEKKDGGQEQPPGNSRKDLQPQPENNKGSSDSPPQAKPGNPQSTQAEQRPGEFSKERALQILDALQNQELAEQRKLLELKARRKATGKDW